MQNKKKTNKTMMRMSSISSLKGIMRAPTKQEKDQEDDDAHIVVFLVERNVRTTTKQEEE